MILNTWANDVSHLIQNQSVAYFDLSFPQEGAVRMFEWADADEEECVLGYGCIFFLSLTMATAFALTFSVQPTYRDVEKHKMIRIS